MLLERLYSPTLCERLLEGEYLRRERPPAWPCDLSAATVSFDVEESPDVRVLPAFCRRLAGMRISASFSVIGRYVERFPEEHRAIVNEGHELVNHSHAHPSHPELCPDRRFDHLSPTEVGTEIKRCHEAVLTHLGVRMTGFRNPHFLGQFNPAIYPALSSLGYDFSSSRSMRDLQATPVEVTDNILELPLSPCPSHLYTVFDSYHMVSKWTLLGKHNEARYFELGRMLADYAVRHHSYMNVYFDPSQVGDCPAFWDFLRFLKERSGLTLLVYADLVRLLPCGGNSGI